MYFVVRLCSSTDAEPHLCHMLEDSEHAQRPQQAFSKLKGYPWVHIGPGISQDVLGTPLSIKAANDVGDAAVPCAAQLCACQCCKAPQKGTLLLIES